MDFVGTKETHTGYVVMKGDSILEVGKGEVPDADDLFPSLGLLKTGIKSLCFCISVPKMMQI